MKVTKKPKSVKVIFEKVNVIQFIPEYLCPSCKVTFKGDIGIFQNTIRFRCPCGQELIVK